MPSQTFLVRAHARTIYTHPVTFVCAECHSTTTREIYPGKMPTYCLSCRPRKKKSAQVESSKGMFHPTHYLIAADGRKTEVCLEKSSNPGWSWVRTALDWFSGSSIIQYHPEKGIISHETPLEGYTLIPFQEEQKSQAKSTTSKAKSKGKKTSTQTISLESKAYSGRQMMKRLKCGDRLLRIKRSQANFSAWSQERDPDNIAWQYKDGEFFPVEITKPEPEPKSSKKEPQPKPLSSKSKTKSKAKQSQKTPQKTKKEPVQAVKTDVQPLSGRQMMKRLKCGDRLLRIKRSQPDFSAWSQERDPEGVAWQYKDDQFIPLEASSPSTDSSKKTESKPKTSSSSAKSKTKSKTEQQKKTTKKSQKKVATQADTLKNQAYSGRELMQRFRCGERLLRIKRALPNFQEWSKQRDPDGIAWKYQKGKFVPQLR